VEVIIASSIFAMMVTTFVGALLYGQEAFALGGNRTRAVLLAEEGLEAARNLRDAGFGNIPDGTYGLAVSGGTWLLSGSADVTGLFTRYLNIASVDAKRKTVTSTVTWQQNAQRTGSVSLVTRLTNWIASTLASWENAFQEASQNAPGNNDGWKIQVQNNYAYLIRNGGTPNFLIYNVSAPASPALVGSLTLTGTPSNIAVSGNYAYVSNQSNTQELQIINISNPAAPNVVGTYNAPGNANANGVFVNGSRAYLVRGSSTDNEFIIVNVATPASPALLGSLNLGATGNGVVVVGNDAYIASGSNTQEVQVVNVTNPASLSIVGSVNLPGNTDALTIAGFSGGVVVGQGNTLYTVNISSPTAPTVAGTLGIGGQVNDIALGRGNTYAFLGTSVATGEFRVVDITSFASPTLVSTVNLAGTSAINGIAYDETLDRAFGASAGNALEFVVFAPQ
jgi:hypothetical protein